MDINVAGNVISTGAAGKILYVSDLDGTLLNSKERINPKSIRMINELIDRGMLFTYATARSMISASVVTQGLSVRMPVIVYNGTFIMRAGTGEILAQENISKQQAGKVRDVLDRHSVSPLVYAFIDGIEKVSWITTKENEGIRRYLSLRKGDRRLRAVADKKELYKGEMFYFTCIGERKELQPVYDIFSEDSRFRCTFQQELYRPEFWCEIMPAKATKANAIMKLKEIQNCKKVISFGDAINDIPMFQVSDESYAVENAVKELKDLATGIIGSNEEDGVARWLKEHVILGAEE